MKKQEKNVEKFLSEVEEKFQKALSVVSDPEFFEKLGPELAVKFQIAARYLYLQGRIEAGQEILASVMGRGHGDSPV